jgi:hydrogenase maturation protein HypF
LAIDEISPNMNTIGAMFYSGTLKLISKTFGKPLIATSGNFHGSPICSTTEEAEQILENCRFFLAQYLRNSASSR